MLLHVAEVKCRSGNFKSVCDCPECCKVDDRIAEIKQHAQTAAFLSEFNAEPAELEQELQTILLLASEALARRSCVRRAQWGLRIAAEAIEQLEGVS